MGQNIVRIIYFHIITLNLLVSYYSIFYIECVTEKKQETINSVEKSYFLHELCFPNQVSNPSVRSPILRDNNLTLQHATGAHC